MLCNLFNLIFLVIISTVLVIHLFSHLTTIFLKCFISAKCYSRLQGNNQEQYSQNSSLH